MSFRWATRIACIIAFALLLTHCGADRTLISIAIVPANQNLTGINQTAQFIAIGTYSKGSHPVTTRDITHEVTWGSSATAVAMIDATGLATSTGVGLTTITAGMSASSTDTVVPGQASLRVSSGAAAELPSLQIHQAGRGSGTIVSNPSGVECVPGKGCNGQFAEGTPVMLTAIPDEGSQFAGWSANCVPAHLTTCTVTIHNRDAVAVIFNH